MHKVLDARSMHPKKHAPSLLYTESGRYNIENPWPFLDNKINISKPILLAQLYGKVKTITTK
jgi:hypothetical protein